jgi:hypothetical protein
MSEAGLLVAKPECQWRPAKHGSKRKCGAVGNGTYRWKALRISESGGVGASPAEGVLVLLEEAGRPVEVRRYDRGRPEPAHRARVG